MTETAAVGAGFVNCGRGSHPLIRIACRAAASSVGSSASAGDTIVIAPKHELTEMDFRECKEAFDKHSKAHGGVLPQKQIAPCMLLALR